MAGCCIIRTTCGMPMMQRTAQAGTYREAAAQGCHHNQRHTCRHNRPHKLQLMSTGPKLPYISCCIGKRPLACAHAPAARTCPMMRALAWLSWSQLTSHELCSIVGAGAVQLGLHVCVEEAPGSCQEAHVAKPAVHRPSAYAAYSQSCSNSLLHIPTAACGYQDGAKLKTQGSEPADVCRCVSRQAVRAGRTGAAGWPAG